MALLFLLARRVISFCVSLIVRAVKKMPLGQTFSEYLNIYFFVERGVLGLSRLCSATHF